MGVDVARGADVAVAEPLLNLFQADAVCVQKACTGMPQIVKPNPSQSVTLEKNRKMICQKPRCNQIADFIQINIGEMTLVIAFTAKLSVFFLLCPLPKQCIFKGFDEWKRSVAGFCLRAVFFNQLEFSVNTYFRNDMTDCNRLLFKVDFYFSCYSSELSRMVFANS